MEKGLKLDFDKLRWDLLPIECVEEIVKVLTFGAKKYADNNWQLVENSTERYYAALMRHIVEWRKGDPVDRDSELNHLSHALCNLIFLLWFEKNQHQTKIIDDLNYEVDEKVTWM